MHGSKGPVAVQLESLQAESEADTTKRMKQEEEMRQDVAEALEGFGAGDLDAEGLLAELREMGIDVECSAEQLTLVARCGSGFYHISVHHDFKVLNARSCLHHTMQCFRMCMLARAQAGTHEAHQQCQVNLTDLTSCCRHQLPGWPHSAANLRIISGHAGLETAPQRSSKAPTGNSWCVAFSPSLPTLQRSGNAGSPICPPPSQL